MNQKHKYALTLFEPRSAPYKGMSSFLAPSALGQGWWSLASNVRSDKGTLYVRNGYLKRTTTAVNSGTGTFFGASQYMDSSYSEQSVLVAISVSNVIQIWGTTAFSNNFVEKTDASSFVGNTRMVPPANNGWVYFAPALYPGDTTNSYLVVQDGTSTPRIVQDMLVDGYAMSIHAAISPPAGKVNSRSKPTHPAYWNIKDGTATTHSTPTGTSVVTADTAGASTNTNTITLTCTNPANGAQARVVFGTSMSISASRQLVIYGNGSLDNFDLFHKLKVSIGDSGTLTPIYDATAVGDSEYAAFSLSSDGETWAIAFNLDTYVNQASGPTTIDRIQFEWAGPSEAAATYAITIYAICGSGKVPGNALHAYTYASSYSRAESVPLYITDSRPDRLYNVGGSVNLTEDYHTVGSSSSIYYNYVIGFSHTSTAQKNAGTDELRLYRQDENEDDYWYVASTTLATVSGTTWTFSNHGSTSAYGKCTLTDSTLAKSFLIRAPDPEHIGIPVGRAMLSANGRLFVAATHGAGGFSKLMISEHRYPFRFRESPRKIDDLMDPRSATAHILDGEDIQGFAAVSVGYGGASFVYVFTDQNIYMIGADVNRIQKIASVGTLSPKSIAEYRGSVYFLDSDRKVRVLEAGVLRDISDRLVEDKLLAIPASTWAASRVIKVTGNVWNGCYRLGYTPVGETTNKRVLVFDIEEQKWYDDALTSPITAEQLLPYIDTANSLALCFGSNLHVYEVEKSGQATDADTNPTLTLTTNEFRMEDWKEFTIGRVGIICDDVSSGSVSVTRSYRPGSGSNSTSTINIDVTPSQAWRYDGAQTLGNDLRGTWGKLSFSLQAPAGTNIYELMCEAHPRGAGATLPA